MLTHCKDRQRRHTRRFAGLAGWVGCLVIIVTVSSGKQPPKIDEHRDRFLEKLSDGDDSLHYLASTPGKCFARLLQFHREVMHR